jgi:hypothetical protein
VLLLPSSVLPLRVSLSQSFVGAFAGPLPPVWREFFLIELLGRKKSEYITKYGRKAADVQRLSSNRQLLPELVDFFDQILLFEGVKPAFSLQGPILLIDASHNDRE